jgi:hypothetical protein
MSSPVGSVALTVRLTDLATSQKNEITRWQMIGLEMIIRPSLSGVPSGFLGTKVDIGALNPLAIFIAVRRSVSLSRIMSLQTKAET